MPKTPAPQTRSRNVVGVSLPSQVFLHLNDYARANHVTVSHAARIGVYRLLDLPLETAQPTRGFAAFVRPLSEVEGSPAVTRLVEQAKAKGVPVEVEATSLLTRAQESVRRATHRAEEAETKLAQLQIDLLAAQQRAAEAEQALQDLLDKRAAATKAISQSDTVPAPARARKPRSPANPAPTNSADATADIDAGLLDQIDDLMADLDDARDAAAPAAQAE